MKEIKPRRRTSVGGSKKQGKFGISSENEAHIMTILRDTLYSDRIMAVIREYSSNAWDAHIDAGKADVPIKITLPTYDEPVFKVRDFGPGLGEDDVFNIYTQYGASTKRKSNSAVGMLGIGCKSGFAYSESFTITSWHEGICSVYSAIIDETNVGEVHQLHQAPCPIDETGVEISIPTQINDREKFHSKAKDLLRFFNPVPVSNIPLTYENVMHETYENGFFLKNANRNWNGRNWVAVMGCIPYTINLDQLGIDYYSGASAITRNTVGGLYFDIGDIEISASREDLKYTQRTIKALKDKLDTFTQEYLDTFDDEIQAASDNWAKRVKVAELVNIFGKQALKAKYGNLVGDVYLAKSNAVFNTFTLKNDYYGLRLHPGTGLGRILVKDINRSLKGYTSIGYDNVIVTPKKKDTSDQVCAELEALALAAKCDGVPIVLMSTLPWTKPYTYQRASGVDTSKHKVSSFAYDDSYKGYSHAASNYWVAEDRVPSDDDAWVVLSRFQVNTPSAFRQIRADDLKLAKKLKIKDVPPVYGYKTTKKKPVDTNDLKGLRYDEWRVKYFKKQFSKELQDTINAQAFISAQTSRKRIPGAALFAKLENALGSQHKIIKCYKKVLDASNLVAKNRKLLKDVTNASDFADLGSTKAFDKEYKGLIKDYPLIEGMVELLGSRRYYDNVTTLDAWVKYIQTIDAI